MRDFFRCYLIACFLLLASVAESAKTSGILFHDRASGCHWFPHLGQYERFGHRQRLEHGPGDCRSTGEAMACRWVSRPGLPGGTWRRC